MEVQFLSKDECEDLRHKVVSYIMEILVRRRPKLNPEELKTVLKHARRKESKIFKRERNKERYCQAVCMELVELDRRQEKRQTAAHSKGTQESTLTSYDKFILHERLGEMLLDLDLMFELKPYQEYEDEVLASMAHTIDMWRIIYHLRLNDEGAEDVSDPRSRPSVVASRQVVWAQMQLLKEVFLRQWRNIRDALGLQSIPRSEASPVLLSEQLSDVHALSWIDDLRRIIHALDRPKQELPERFRRRTIHRLKKHVQTTAFRLFWDWDVDTCTSLNAAATHKGVDPVVGSDISQATDSSELEGEPSISASYIEPSSQMQKYITRFLVEIDRSRSRISMEFDQHSCYP